MADKFQLILIFISVLIGLVSAAYLYQSSAIFLNLLRRPLKFIASGMLVIAVGVLLGAFISYESNLGVNFVLYNIPLPAYFYILYIIGCILILIGARQFTHRPKDVVDVSLQGR